MADDTAQSGLDFSLCAREPIHTPGAIQPHGALLASRIGDLLVSHASANLGEILGVSAQTALGQPLEQSISKVACSALLDAKSHDRVAIHQIKSQLPGQQGETLRLSAHQVGQHICIDIEPVLTDPAQTSPIHMVQSYLKTLERAEGQRELCALAVRGLREITGYDRVMAYRFDRDGHGEVIAEARISRLESYLGLHYPATDIPPQARRLYLRQRVGAIVDSSYRPVQVLADQMLNDGTPLDLTCSILRSVSPPCVGYFHEGFAMHRVWCAGHQK